MNAVQTRLRLPKCISFQCCGWKWLLAHAPSTRPPTYISTAKSTYIDQIAHLRLLVVVDMSPSTALALNTCRNTIWVHMCRHAHLRICRLPVHYASPNCCISTAKFIFTCQITHLRLKKASMMSTATYMAIQVSTIRMYMQNYICLLILQYMRCHCLSFLSFSQPIFLPWWQPNAQQAQRATRSLRFPHQNRQLIHQACPQGRQCNHLRAWLPACRFRRQTRMLSLRDAFLRRNWACLHFQAKQGYHLRHWVPPLPCSALYWARGPSVTLRKNKGHFGFQGSDCGSQTASSFEITERS